MEKIPQTYDLEIPDDDYKMAAVMEQDKANFESPNIWLYLGADLKNPGYAKVGITMSDLRSRSYSSANPNYYLFCAFQCKQSTTKSQLESIERSALTYLDRIFGNRARHAESQRLSECYYDVDFEDFFVCLHDYLFDNHANFFQISGKMTETGLEDDRCALSWLFNPCVPLNIREHFLEMILRS